MLSETIKMLCNPFGMQRGEEGSMGGWIKEFQNMVSEPTTNGYLVGIDSLQITIECNAVA